MHRKFIAFVVASSTALAVFAAPPAKADSSEAFGILAGLAAFALIGPCVKLFSLPRGILMPLILPVCIIGAYAVKLSMFDVWIMFAAGVVGWLFTVFKFPVAPVVLGVILAPLADENFRRSLLVFEDKSIGFVLSNWIGTFLMLAVLFVIAEGAYRVWTSARASRATLDPQPET